MNGDIYVRDGSRFKKVPNMVGLYYNGIILTKERMPDSIGVVVDQKYDHLVVGAIKSSNLKMEWWNAKEWCKKQFNGKGRMPEIEELVLSRKYIDDYGQFWSNTEYTMAPYIAWVLRWGHCHAYNENKAHNGYARAVLDIPIKDII